MVSPPGLPNSICIQNFECNTCALKQYDFAHKKIRRPWVYRLLATPSSEFQNFIRARIPRLDNKYIQTVFKNSTVYKQLSDEILLTLQKKIPSVFVCEKLYPSIQPTNAKQTSSTFIVNRISSHEC